MDVELRLAELKGALDLGMAEIKGSVQLLVQGAANDRDNLVKYQENVKQALEKVADEHQADRAAQARKDEDQENRLRLVDPLPARVQALEEAQAELTKAVSGLAVRVAMWSGGIAVAATVASALISYALNH